MNSTDENTQFEDDGFNNEHDEKRRKARALAARKKADRKEREEYDEAVEVAKIRTKLVPALFVAVFVVSFIVSGRDGWLTAWPESFVRSFVSFGLATWITLIAAIAVLVARFAVPRWLVSRGGSARSSMTTAITAATLTLMIGAGVVVPVAAWIDARGILPSVKFNRCVGSLRGSAAVALNKKDDGSQFVTVASAKNGIQKYALEPSGNGWKVTNMYTNKEVSNLEGC